MRELTVTLTEKEATFLEQYATVFEKERAEDVTLNPIVAVEIERDIVVPDEFGDNVIYVDTEADENFKMRTIEDVKEFLEERVDDEPENYPVNYIETTLEKLRDEGVYEGENMKIEKFTITTIFEPVAYFLTRAEAERYMKYQKHNLNKPRVYTRDCGYSNAGDLQCLIKTLQKMGEQLIAEQ